MIFKLYYHINFNFFEEKIISPDNFFEEKIYWAPDDPQQLNNLPRQELTPRETAG